MNLEKESGLNGMRDYARYTRVHRVGGVAGGAVHSARYCVDDAVSMNSAPSFSPKLRKERWLSLDV